MRPLKPVHASVAFVSVYSNLACLVPSSKTIQVFSAQNVFFKSIAIQYSACSQIILILHDSTEDLEDRCDTTASTDHEESLDYTLITVDRASPLPKIFEFADGSFEVDRVPNGNGIQRFGHLASLLLRGIIVHFDQDVDFAFVCDFRDGRVGPGNCFSRHGIRSLIMRCWPVGR